MDQLQNHGDKYPDHDRLIVNHYMWVDGMVAPPGKKLSEMPPNERKGYGQILSNYEEAVQLAYNAFRETTQFHNPETKVKIYPKMEKREHDTRAVFMIMMDIATYRAGGEQNGRLWTYIQGRKNWPAFDGFTIEKTYTFPKKLPEEERHRVVLCLKADWVWEEIIKGLPKAFNERSKEWEHVLNTPMGPIAFEPRRPGGGDKDVQSG